MKKTNKIAINSARKVWQYNGTNRKIKKYIKKCNIILVRNLQSTTNLATYIKGLWIAQNDMT